MILWITFRSSAFQLLDLSVARKRELMSMADHEFSVSVLCDVIGLARSSFYYKSQASDDSELRSDIESICLRYTRYGDDYWADFSARDTEWDITVSTV